MFLALDTSTLTTSLALVHRDGRVVAERRSPPPAKQSDVLPGLIAELLAEAGAVMNELDGFAVGLGPGSFTGLRIGLSTVKGLAYALEKPVVGASSLAMLALEGPEAVELLVVAVVKKGELYVGHFRRRGAALDTLSPEVSLTVAQFADRAVKAPGARVLGPALVEYREALVGLGVPAERLLAGPLVPSAATLAHLVKWPATYSKEALFSLEPHYLRGSGAEENPKFPPLPGVEPRARLKEE